MLIMSPRPQLRKNGRAKENDKPNETPDAPDEQGRSIRPDNSWRWILFVLMAVVVLMLVVPGTFTNKKYKSITYNQFLGAVQSKTPADQIQSAAIDNSTGVITGEFRTVDGKTRGAFRAEGPLPPTEDQTRMLTENGVQFTFKKPSSGSLWGYILPFLPLVVIVAVFYFLLRRQAQGQMNGISAIGRSKAKVYTTERPKTTFDDVAGYKGVKQEVNEVVDFLKNNERFESIGAKIPKGILLVGPPGTGKTLIARAVAGEAGVPFLAITGSDFMEMFVGVGASRVRDLFQTARKQAPAIIFIDEIDSIGRKRGAGLGGGHDEREQTLNQMLSEMDGFEASEGVVMIAATNRPDILDPALLRPGRFDRQVVVPLPDMEERLPILEVHSKNKKMSPDVDLSLVAKGTPGMSGADLANLVNEAALHAVRRGADMVHSSDFEAARDRIFVGQRRESTVLSDEEKERVAYHEGGHAVLAYVLPNADPLHKVTILPTGMALGVTHQVPMEEKHIYKKIAIEDALAVRMGGRVAEMMVYGDLSTGASSDLVGNTDLARRMVREWGMSEKIGPAAWGSQGQVFLGEDLLHSGDQYSPSTSETIDQEVQRILRESEARATEYLTLHREGLNKLAEALLERETLDGEEAARIIDEAFGRPVHPEDDKRAHFTSPLSTAPIRDGIVGIGSDPDQPSTPDISGD
jgi:cell division protease FtsH